MNLLYLVPMYIEYRIINYFIIHMSLGVPLRSAIDYLLFTLFFVSFLLYFVVMLLDIMWSDYLLKRVNREILSRLIVYNLLFNISKDEKVY